MAELSVSYSFYVLRPDLAKEWHPTRNGSLSPKDVTPESQMEVWWLCENGHWWQASVHDRVRGRKCIFCQDLMDLANQRMVNIKPALLKEWHPTRNAGLRPKDVTSGYKPEVWWICEQGHEWEETIPRRLADTDCPFCGNRTPITSLMESPGISSISQSGSDHGQFSDHTSFASLQKNTTASYGGTDFRGSRRYARSVVVMLEKPNSETLGYAELHNFSAGGMMLRSNFLVSPGEFLRVRVDRPLYPWTSKVVNSKVIWCRDLGDQNETITRFGIGVSL